MEPPRPGPKTWIAPPMDLTSPAALVAKVDALEGKVTQLLAMARAEYNMTVAIHEATQARHVSGRDMPRMGSQPEWTDPNHALLEEMRKEIQAGVNAHKSDIEALKREAYAQKQIADFKRWQFGVGLAVMSLASAGVGWFLSHVAH